MAGPLDSAQRSRYFGDIPSGTCPMRNADTVIRHLAMSRRDGLVGSAEAVAPRRQVLTMAGLLASGKDQILRGSYCLKRFSAVQ